MAESSKITPEVKALTVSPGAVRIPVRDYYNPDEEQLRVLRHVYNNRFIQMRDAPDRLDVMGKLDKWEKQWESYRIPNSVTRQEDWMSNHVIPLTTSIVETALSEMIRSNLRPLVLPWGAEDQPKAMVMGHIWDFLWSVSGGDITMYNVMKDLLINGTAIVQEYYLKDRRIVREMDAKGKITQKEIFDYDDCMMENVKLQDFYVDEYARGFDGPYAARDCIRRYIMNIDDFHVAYDGSVWDQYDNAKLVKPGGDTEWYEFFKPPQGYIRGEQVEVLHYWSVKPTDAFVIVANDVVIRNGPNPYKHKQLPFARAVDIKRTHKFYAKGEPELLESTQDEANVLRRMIIDRNHLDIDKMFFVSNRLGLSDEDLMARPHGMIPTDDVNGAKAVEYGDIPRSVEMSLGHLSDDSIISTGINPRAQALPTAGTATEAAILKESTVRRIEMKLWLLRKEFMPRIGMLRSANILQFYPQPRLEEIVGEKGTAEYKAECDRLRQQGILHEPDGGGDPMQMVNRTIPIKGKAINVDAAGAMSQQNVPGYSFFELKPQYYVPKRGGYWFKFEAGNNLDTSKPLMQQKDLELADRITPIAFQIPGSYDLVKVYDMIIKDFDKNPDDLKPDMPQPGQMGQQPMGDDGIRTQMLAQAANMENQQMMQGKQVPATPYANQAHTMIHIMFMRGPDFMNLPNHDPRIQDFTDHVMGEIAAQEARGMSGVTGAMPTQENPQMQQQLPQGQAPKQGGQANGMMNRLGGPAQPSMRVGDIQPNINTGGNPKK